MDTHIDENHERLALFADQLNGIQGKCDTFPQNDTCSKPNVMPGMPGMVNVVAWYGQCCNNVLAHLASSAAAAAELPSFVTEALPMDHFAVELEKLADKVRILEDASSAPAAAAAVDQSVSCLPALEAIVADTS